MGGSLTSIVVIPRCNRGGAPTEAYPVQTAQGPERLALAVSVYGLTMFIRDRERHVAE